MKSKGMGTADIPVRRYGTVPAWVQEEASWELEAPASPRTIGEFGAGAVILAALFAAAVAGLLLYVK